MEHNPEKQHGGIVKLDRILSSIESWVTVVCFILMCIIVIAGIVMRFILRTPNPYGEEASRYLMIIGIFIGVSIGARQGSHLGMTLLVDSLPAAPARVVALLSSVISLVGYILLSLFSLMFIQRMYTFGQTSPAMDLPMWAVYSVLFVGFVLSAARTGMMIWNDFISRRKPLSVKGEG